VTQPQGLHWPRAPTHRGPDKDGVIRLLPTVPRKHPLSESEQGEVMAYPSCYFLLLVPLTKIEAL
jgi:hypothetical protein